MEEFGLDAFEIEVEDDNGPVRTFIFGQRFLDDGSNARRSAPAGMGHRAVVV